VRPSRPVVRKFFDPGPNQTAPAGVSRNNHTYDGPRITRQDLDQTDWSYPWAPSSRGTSPSSSWSSRSLRIIKAETKGLVDDNDNVAEKAEPQYSRQPLHPDAIQQPGQPGFQQAPPAGYQQPGYQQQPNGQQFQQPQQPPAQPYVDPVQRTNDR
jgi:sec-independent protein translocase protein TatA